MINWERITNKSMKFEIVAASERLNLCENTKNYLDSQIKNYGSVDFTLI